MHRFLERAVAAIIVLLSRSVSALHVDVFRPSERSYFVTSTIVSGPTEALLIDAQMTNSEAAKLADRIARSGKRLKGIFITHPVLDHYIGLTVLHERFPDAPIYMTDIGLGQFRRSSEKSIAGRKKSAPAETPDTLPAPAAVHTTEFSVDGESILLIKDFQGDVLEPANSFLWIPSLQT